jgi:hypothetical protein
LILTFVSNQTTIAIDDDDPEVIHLQINGSCDVNMNDLSANDLMAWGLANISNEEEEGSYLVRHGSKAVRDIGLRRSDASQCSDEENFWEKAFPCLFPYGRGGMESNRRAEVSFQEHIRWALRYHDRRFRIHETFPFLCFGILQKREALLSARLQMRQANFDRDARILASITKQQLEQAAIRETQGRPVTNPAIQLLRKHVHAAALRVKGSNESRTSLRSQIMWTNVMKNPLNLWVTINPTDIHDPIAQIFCGENIDLDNFLATVGPDAEQRARNIALDPYAAAKFFHFLIQAILETLFGIKVTDYQIHNRDGIFGRVSAYFGTVESQGRGTLHLHLLLWLENAPTSEVMSEMLRSEAFRMKVANFIHANLRAYLPGLESAESTRAIPRDKEIAWNRPPNPNSTRYSDELTRFELQLARSEQIHTCCPRRCLLQDKNGNFYCKRRAPFEISENDSIEVNGQWHQKRLYEYVNGWIPGILINARCNNDGKLITNGEDTKNITMYTTLYAAKKQNRNYNLSAVMAKAYAYHVDHLEGLADEYINSIRNTQRLLLFRVLHSINREQEIAGAMVISYLMGWGDVFRSNHYSPIYWSSFVHYLLSNIPSLQLDEQVLPHIHVTLSN